MFEFAILILVFAIVASLFADVLGGFINLVIARKPAQAPNALGLMSEPVAIRRTSRLPQRRD